MKQVKFPSGSVGYELLHYMGADDQQHYMQRSEEARRLIDKCRIDTVVSLDKEEIAQLIKEVKNAIDIKQDHVGDGSWSGLQQYSLTRFLNKLKML
jgi:hypothetical protein